MKTCLLLEGKRHRNEGDNKTNMGIIMPVFKVAEIVFDVKSTLKLKLGCLGKESKNVIDDCVVSFLMYLFSILQNVYGGRKLKMGDYWGTVEGFPQFSMVDF